MNELVKFGQISIFKYEGIMETNLYERRVYESVDEKSLYRVISRNFMKKIIQVIKG